MIDFSALRARAKQERERQRFVAAALSFQGTKYHHHGRIKGVGVDCATLLVLAAEEAGLVESFALPEYSPQWHLNRASQRYLATILTVCKTVPLPPLPGDIAIWQFGRVFSHGAIVVEWPRIVHACVGHQVRVDDVSANPWLTHIGELGPMYGKERPMMLVSFWGR